MKRHVAYRAAQMEGLEDRRLFSVVPLGVGVDAVHQGPSVGAPKVTTPNVVGTYTGTVSDSNEAHPGTLSFVITSQNNGVITGYQVSTYFGQEPRTNDFTGTISGDSIVVTTSTTKVTATVSNNGKVTSITGSYTFRSGSDSSIGHFVVKS